MSELEVLNENINLYLNQKHNSETESFIIMVDDIASNNYSCYSIAKISFL